MGGGWDFWETADWARAVEHIAYSTTPTRGKLLYDTAILDTGDITSVASADWVQRWDVDSGPNLLRIDNAFRFGPVSPVLSIGTYNIEAATPLSNDQQKKDRASCSFCFDAVGAVAPPLVSRSCVRCMGAIVNSNGNSPQVGNNGRCSLQISRNNHRLLHLEPPGREKRRSVYQWTAQGELRYEEDLPERAWPVRATSRPKRAPNNPTSRPEPIAHPPECNGPSNAVIPEGDPSHVPLGVIRRIHMRIGHASRSAIC